MEYIFFYREGQWDVLPVSHSPTRQVSWSLFLEKCYTLEVRNTSKNCELSVKVFHLMVSENGIHDPKGQDNIIYTIVKGM